MFRSLLLVAFGAALALPIASLADPTSPAATTVSTAGTSAPQIAPGTYTVRVINVVDAKHVLVAMDDGAKATLAAGRPNVDFTKLQANDSIKVSINNGAVLVFLDLTTH
ncbi:MAG: hypothetical protein ACLQPV_06890 [Vulcanimicrobiaceae bacterium]